jgi:hypothetical protein
MTLHCQWLLPSIKKNNYILELKSLLEEDDSGSKENLYKSLQFAWMHPCKFACIGPLLSSLTSFLGLDDGFLQIWLCFFNWKWVQVEIICGILATIKQCRAPNKPIQKMQTNQKLHKTWWDLECKSHVVTHTKDLCGNNVPKSQEFKEKIS